MTTFSEIKITFNEDIPLNGLLSFRVDTDAFHNLLAEQWKELRTAPNQVEIGNPTSIAGERSAINYVTSFNLDYNLSNQYVIERVGNVVTIKSTDPKVNFSDGKAFEFVEPTSPVVIDTSIDALTTPLVDAVSYDVVFEYTNFSQSNLLKLEEFEINPTANPCQSVSVQFTTSVVAPIIKGFGFNIVDNTENPFVFEVLRGAKKIGLSISTNDGQKIPFFTDVPSVLVINDVEINYLPNGSDISIIVLNQTLLELEYSIDNINWSSAKKFTGLSNGNYTAYVKDQYGCITQKQFEISNKTISDPYAYFSKSNSLRYVLRKKNGIDTNRLVDENAFACEDLAQVTEPIIQKYLEKDYIQTQFKTNYQNQSIKIVDNTGLETIVVPEKKTNNIELKDMREAIIYDYGFGKMGMYFTAGKLFDYDTQSDTGNMYVLNGGLPEWAKVGQFVNTVYGWLEIKNIVPSNEKNAEVLIFDYSFTESERVATVSTVYNRDNYEVYEFGVDCLLHQNKMFRVFVELSDPNFGTLNYETEVVRVNKELEKHFAKINYRNDTNTDVFYNTGIEFLFRLGVESLTDTPSGDSETHKTDTQAILLSGEANEEKEIKFLPIPRGYALKLFYALLHRELTINETNYVVSDTPDAPERLDQSNLYVVTAKIVKSKEQYNSKSNNNDLPSLSGLKELPNYVLNGTGFIKI